MTQVLTDLPESHRYVDMWALPGMHPSNSELLQTLKTADTNHFTKGMDVVGTVSTHHRQSGDWQETHLVGLRSDVWTADKHELAAALKSVRARRKKELKEEIKRSGRLDEQQSAALDHQIDADAIMKMQGSDIERRRLVLKLFKTTGTRVRWCGTIEEITTTEVHNSIGSKRSLLTMVVMLPRSQYVTHVQQNHRTFRVPAIFTFSYYVDQRMWHLSLKRQWLSMGADFVVEADGEKIGELDGKLLSFGSDSYLDLDGHELAADTRFVDLLTLFTASAGYHKAMRRSVRRRVDAALAGRSYCHLIEDEELRLHQNGRAAA